MFGRDIWISCDYDYYDSCDTEEFHAPLGSTTFTELTRLARAEGWSIGARNHFCPAHRHLARSNPPKGRT